MVAVAVDNLNFHYLCHRYKRKMAIKQKHIGVVIIMLSLFCACKADLDKQSEKHISKKKMVDILYDIHMYDGISNILPGYNPFNLKVNEKSVYNFILDKHQVSDSLLAISIIYYSSIPKLYEEIYADVVQRLSIKSEEMKKIDDKIRKEQQRLEEVRLNRVRDSLAIIFTDSVSVVLVSYKNTADSLYLSLDSLLKSQDSISKDISNLRRKGERLNVNIDSLLNSIDSTYQLPVDTLINVNISE